MEPRVSMIIRIGAALGVAPGDMVNDMAAIVAELRLQQGDMPSTEPELPQRATKEMDDDFDGPGM